ncbi:MAG: TIR domain-containing protein [Chloroflexota bacterium]|nr:TIR domain-containing protein [Chloroflexota bacterium]
MARLFISYRRSDSTTATGRIYDRLVEAFGIENIFKDVDALMIGVDFRSVINREIGSSDALLAIIGKNWLNAVDDDGKRRLDNPNDFVRLEIEFALRRRAMLIVPVLVSGAQMPSAGDLPVSMEDFAFRHAAQVRDDPDFRTDMSRLTESIIKYINQNTPTSQVEMIRQSLPKDIVNGAPPKPVKTAPSILDDTDDAVQILPSNRLPDTDVFPLPKDATTTSLTREDIQRRIQQDSRPATQPKPPISLHPNPLPVVTPPIAEPPPANDFEDEPTTVRGTVIDFTPRTPPPRLVQNTVQQSPLQNVPSGTTLPPDLPPMRGSGTDIRLILIGIAILLMLTIILTLIATRT